MMEKIHLQPIIIVTAFTALLANFGWATFATLNADHKNAKPQPEFVTAALSPPDQTQGEPEEPLKLLDRIRPTIGSIDREQQREQRVASAVEANVRASVKQLRAVPSIALAMKEKNIKVIGAIYHIDSGEITFRDE